MWDAAIGLEMKLLQSMIVSFNLLFFYCSLCICICACPWSTCVCVSQPLYMFVFMSVYVYLSFCASLCSQVRASLRLYMCTSLSDVLPTPLVLAALLPVFCLISPLSDSVSSRLKSANVLSLTSRRPFLRLHVFLLSLQAKGDMDALEGQQGRLLALHERHVAVPLLNMEQSWETYTDLLRNLELEVCRGNGMEKERL